LASAAVTAAGTDRGTKALAAVSINPITLFGGSASEAATWSRVADLTVLVPLQNDSSASSAGHLSYLGLRARFNLDGFRAGSRLLADVDAAFQAALTSETDLAARLAKAFRGLGTAAEVEACARAVRGSRWGETPGDCGGRVTIGLEEADYRRLREALVRAREVADARYLGLDLRFDAGDPALSGKSANEVLAIQAGLAFGRRSLGATTAATAFGVAGRLGARYSALRAHADSVVWSLDAALGLEASRLISPDLAARLDLGLELRYANARKDVADQHQTDYLAIRGGVTIPMAMGTSVTVSFAAPIVGDLSPSLAVNFNWAMLFSVLASGPGR
jgi:hypothetical protein